MDYIVFSTHVVPYTYEYMHIAQSKAACAETLMDASCEHDPAEI